MGDTAGADCDPTNRSRLLLATGVRSNSRASTTSSGTVGGIKGSSSEENDASLTRTPRDPQQVTRLLTMNSSCCSQLFVGLVDLVNSPPLDTSARRATLRLWPATDSPPRLQLQHLLGTPPAVQSPREEAAAQPSTTRPHGAARSRGFQTPCPRGGVGVCNRANP